MHPPPLTAVQLSGTIAVARIQWGGRIGRLAPPGDRGLRLGANWGPAMVRRCRFWSGGTPWHIGEIGGFVSAHRLRSFGRHSARNASRASRSACGRTPKAMIARYRPPTVPSPPAIHYTPPGAYRSAEGSVDADPRLPWTPRPMWLSLPRLAASHRSPGRHLPTTRHAWLTSGPRVCRICTTTRAASTKCLASSRSIILGLLPMFHVDIKHMVRQYVAGRQPSCSPRASPAPGRELHRRGPQPNCTHSVSRSWPAS
jgi:hypothetical protein